MGKDPVNSGGETRNLPPCGHVRGVRGDVKGRGTLQPPTCPSQPEEP